MPEQTLKAYQVGDYDIVAAYDEAGAIRVLLEQQGDAENHYGYTTNLDEAETFTRDRAVRQYKCRETDLPWPVDYVRARAEYGVDHQDLDLSRTQALATAPADDRIYVAYDRDWDGNCLIWIPEAAGRTSNLAAARTWPLDHAGILTARGYAPWPKSYIDQHARPVAVAASLNHKQALRLFGLKLPKQALDKSAQPTLFT